MATIEQRGITQLNRKSIQVNGSLNKESEDNLQAFISSFTEVQGRLNRSRVRRSASWISTLIPYVGEGKLASQIARELAEAEGIVISPQHASAVLSKARKDGIIPRMSSEEYERALVQDRMDTLNRKKELEDRLETDSLDILTKRGATKRDAINFYTFESRFKRNSDHDKNTLLAQLLVQGKIIGTDLSFWNIAVAVGSENLSETLVREGYVRARIAEIIDDNQDLMYVYDQMVNEIDGKWFNSPLEAKKRLEAKKYISTLLKASLGELISSPK